MIRALLLYYLLIPFIHFRDEVALHAVNATFVQHLLYPLAHANFIHWALNGLSLLTLSQWITPGRTAVAYVFSVLCGYVYSPSLPLLGMSVIVYFYLGMLFIYLPTWRRWRILIIAAAGLFVPSIAAVNHVIMLACGIMSELFILNANRLK